MLPTQSFWNEERQVLYDVLFPEIEAALGEGLIGGADLLNTQLGMDWVLLNEWASDFARTYTYELVKDITNSTQALLQEKVDIWIQSGAPLDDLMTSLEDVYGEYRAFMIASTEVTRAYGEGNLEAWRASGMVMGKRWMTAEDELVCEICGPLDGEIIDLDAADWEGYEGTVDTPPAHVNCRCWMAPVTGE